MFFKGYIRKTISALLLSFSAVSMLTVPVSAASYPEAYVVMGLGRTNAMLINSGSPKIENIDEISSYKDFAGTPVLYNGATYVPFRYVMEKAGFTIGWDNNAITIKRKNRQFYVWSKDDFGKVKKTEASTIEY